MPKLPRVSGTDAVKAFEKVGYRVIRQRGSHIRLKHSHPSRDPLSIPDHKELGIGLLRKLIRDSKVTVKEFIDLLRQ